MMPPPAGRLLDLVGLGVSTIDQILYVDRYPMEDSKVSCSRSFKECGGVGSNIVWGAARLGARAAILSKVGSDPNGATILEAFDAVGADRSGVVIETGGRTAFTTVIVSRATGTRTCVHDRSGLITYNPSEIDLECISRTRLFVSDCRFPDATGLCLDLAKSANATTVLSVESVSAIVPRLTQSADIVIIPERLVASGTGIHHDIRAFAGAGRIRNLIITRGRNGCAMLGTDGDIREIPAGTIEIADTIGAGDAFTAGFCAALLDGVSLERACDVACRVATLTCGAPGARSGMPAREDFVKMLAL